MSERKFNKKIINKLNNKVLHLYTNNSNESKKTIKFLREKANLHVLTLPDNALDKPELYIGINVYHGLKEIENLLYGY